MKTLFIQTHELAKKLDPNMYICPQATSFLLEKTGGPAFKLGVSAGFCLADSASLLVLSLFKEQKEELNWSGISPILGYCKGETYINGFYLSRIINIDENMWYEQRLLKSVEIRQRLINSLLTRPDRTMCVLIPE